MSEWTTHCVKCGRVNRMPRQACIWCGEPIPETEQTVQSPEASPLETGELPEEPVWTIHNPRPPHNLLDKVDLGPCAVYRDSETQGVFITHQVLEFLVQAEVKRARENLGKVTKTQLRQTVYRGNLEETVQYINCPVCGQQMQRKNFMKVSGVIIDECLSHGVWFDADELKQVLQFIATGGKDLLEKLEKEASEAYQYKSAKYVPDGRSYLRFRGGYMSF